MSDRRGERRESEGFLFFGEEGEFEKRRLSLSSRQSNAAERCSSSESFKDRFCGVSALLDGVKNKTQDVDFNKAEEE